MADFGFVLGQTCLERYPGVCYRQIANQQSEISNKKNPRFLSARFFFARHFSDNRFSNA